MNKKLALQTLNQIKGDEQDKEKRKLIDIVSSWLKLDKPFSLALAITLIKEYK